MKNIRISLNMLFGEFAQVWSKAIVLACCTVILFSLGANNYLLAVEICTPVPVYKGTRQQLRSSIISYSDWMALNYYPGVLGHVYAIACSKENVFIGGKFNGAGNIICNNVARLNGSNFCPLGSGMDSTVLCMACDKRGTLFTGGEFHNAGGKPANHIAKWDGTTWSPLGAGLDGEVKAMVFDTAGNLYVCGKFLNAGGKPARRIAKWDGKNWSQLGTGIAFAKTYDTGVVALASDGKENIYVSGGFDTAGGVPVLNIARWNGMTWDSVGPGLTGYVKSLTFNKTGILYAGGLIYRIGTDGAKVKHFVKWDGNSWTQVGDGYPFDFGGEYVNGLSSLLCDAEQNVYIGGPTVYPAVSKWDGNSLDSLNPGPHWTQGIASVFAIARDSNGIMYVGGIFSTAGNKAARNIAIRDDNQWKPLGTCLEMDYFCDMMKTKNEDLLLVGRFFIDSMKAAIVKYSAGAWGAVMPDYAETADFDNNGQIYYIASPHQLNKWDGKTAVELGATQTSFKPYCEFDDLVYDDHGTGKLYVIGTFDTIFHGSSKRTVKNIAQWNGSAWSGLSSGLKKRADLIGGNIVLDSKGNLYATGGFTTAGDIEVNGVAKWDGASWSPLGTGLPATFYSHSIICDKDSILYILGSYESSRGLNVIARWDGKTWSIIKAEPDEEICAISVDQSGNLYAGGYFSTIGGIPAEHLAKWDGNSWSTVGSGTDGSVTSLTVINDILYIGGKFNRAGSLVSPGIAALNLHEISSTHSIEKHEFNLISFKLTKSFLNISNLMKTDIISLYLASGRCIRKYTGASIIPLTGIARQPLIIQVVRKGVIAKTGVVIIR